MAEVLSKQPRFEQKKDLAPFVWTVWEEYLEADEIPPWGAMGRAQKLRDAARAEPILSGALSSMVAKATSLDWQISGGRNRVHRYQEILAQADNGKGWSTFLQRWLQDYLNTDIGGLVELGRQGENGPVLGLFNLDAAQCTLTGNVDFPLRYEPSIQAGVLSGQQIRYRPLDYSSIVDMPAPEEGKFGLGFCAVSRALKAAKILMALYHYEDEKLSDMPLPGIISVTGMTMEEVKSAFDMYKAKRDSKSQVVFKGLLWLAAQQSALNPITTNYVSFADLPDGFDREQVVTQYVYVLSLDFGVDVREFWPASQTGATKAEAEVQAQKAKGKGFGKMLSTVERSINWDVLPEGLEFLFDQRDSEDDLVRETIRAQAIGNVRKLWEPTMAGEGIITTDEARRWLVELSAAPDWLAPTDDTTLHGDANVEEATDQALTQKAARAQLEPGEDLVAVNRAGDTVTIWSPRTVFVSNWPVPGGAGREHPFSTLTTEYARRLRR